MKACKSHIYIYKQFFTYYTRIIYGNIPKHMQKIDTEYVKICKNL